MESFKTELVLLKNTEIFLISYDNYILCERQGLFELEYFIIFFVVSNLYLNS